MIAPITASVTPIRRPPKIAGSAAGISTPVRTCRCRLNARDISMSCRSTDTDHVEMATEEHDEAQITTWESSPVPNHRR
jgi:hypothetical protein